jgi:hypothetical protein
MQMTGFRNEDIIQLAGNLGGTAPLLVVRYTDGYVSVLDYTLVNGGLITTVPVAQSMMSFVGGHFRDLADSLLGGNLEAGDADDPNGEVVGGADIAPEDGTGESKSSGDAAGDGEAGGAQPGEGESTGTGAAETADAVGSGAGTGVGTLIPASGEGGLGAGAGAGIGAGDAGAGAGELGTAAASPGMAGGGIDVGMAGGDAVNGAGAADGAGMDAVAASPATGAAAGLSAETSALLERLAGEGITAYVPGVGLVVNGELKFREGEAEYIPGVGVLVDGNTEYVESAPAGEDAASEEDDAARGGDAADRGEYIPVVAAPRAAGLKAAVTELSSYNPETKQYEALDVASLMESSDATRDGSGADAGRNAGIDAGERADAGDEQTVASVDAGNLQIGGGIGRTLSATQQNGLILVIIIALAAVLILSALYMRAVRRRKQ